MSKEKNKLIHLSYWLGLNCGCKGMMENLNNKHEPMWYMIDDAEELFDGVDDDTLPLYTSEEITEVFLNSK